MIGSDRIGSDRIGSDRIGSDRIGSTSWGILSSGGSIEQVAAGCYQTAFSNRLND